MCWCCKTARSPILPRWGTEQRFLSTPTRWSLELDPLWRCSYYICRIVVRLWYILWSEKIYSTGHGDGSSFGPKRRRLIAPLTLDSYNNVLSARLLCGRVPLQVSTTRNPSIVLPVVLDFVNFFRGREVSNSIWCLISFVNDRTACGIWNVKW